jgi:hypothetical protein
MVYGIYYIATMVKIPLDALDQLFFARTVGPSLAQSDLSLAPWGEPRGEARGATVPCPKAEDSDFLRQKLEKINRNWRKTMEIP